jgi:hypothetical protein
MLVKPRSTEKTNTVLEQLVELPGEKADPPKDHRRNGATAYTGAKKVPVPHPP